MSKSSVRIMLLLGSAAFFAFSTGILSLALHREKNQSKSLETMLAYTAQGRSVTGEFLPADIDHHYELSGHKIFLEDPTYGQIWLPVLADVPLSSHPKEQMKQDTETMRMHSYDAEGNENAIMGIDISAHNNVTDWNAVKADGIDFVMLRVGNRTYGGGVINADTMFPQNYQNAKAAGLKIGAYFFSQAVSEDEAVEEALFTAKQLEGLTLDFPVAYDWEIIFDDDEARTDHVSVDTLTNCTLAFCQNMEKFGFSPMIYQNKRTALLKYDLPRLQGYPFWLAEYDDGPTYIYDYAMWQYSCKGTVAGVEGNVDMNLAYPEMLG